MVFVIVVFAGDGFCLFQESKTHRKGIHEIEFFCSIVGSTLSDGSLYLLCQNHEIVKFMNWGKFAPYPTCCFAIFIQNSNVWTKLQPVF